MEYAFARSDRRLAQPDFDPVLLNALVSASEMAHWMLHFNWVFRILQSLPLWLAKKLNPGFVVPPYLAAVNTLTNHSHTRLGKLLDFQEVCIVFIEVGL